MNLKLAKEKAPTSIPDSRSFRLPLKEKPAVAQRSEIIRSRDYIEDDTKFNALCRGEKLLVDIVLHRHAGHHSVATYNNNKNFDFE
jgi:hypothetical protein